MCGKGKQFFYFWQTSLNCGEIGDITKHTVTLVRDTLHWVMIYCKIGCGKTGVLRFNDNRDIHY